MVEVGEAKAVASPNRRTASNLGKRALGKELPGSKTKIGIGTDEVLHQDPTKKWKFQLGKRQMTDG